MIAKTPDPYAAAMANTLKEHADTARAADHALYRKSLAVSNEIAGAAGLTKDDIRELENTPCDIGAYTIHGATRHLPQGWVTLLQVAPKGGEIFNPENYPEGWGTISRGTGSITVPPASVVSELIAAMTTTPDPYDAIERELAAEDERVGEWPPPQWWAKAKTTGTYTTGDGVTHAIPPGTVVYATDLDTGERVEHMTITDWPTPAACNSPSEPVTIEFDDVPDATQYRPLLRDNHGEPIDIGRPLTRREGFWLATTIAAVIVGLLGLAWFALWVLGGGA